MVFECFFYRIKNNKWTIRRVVFAALLLPAIACSHNVFGLAHVSKPSLSRQVAAATMRRWPDGRFVPPGTAWQWNYQLGTLLAGMNALWYNTADASYYNYLKKSIDGLVASDGSIPTYDSKEESLDDVMPGRQLLLLYRVTQDVKYYKAASILRKQLSTQPRSASGGLWHKRISPDQMLLDDQYMVEPFYAEYASLFNEPQDFPDITRQLVLLEQHARDPKSGLLYHEWDETHKEAWADKTKGTSPNFWSRGMGWYMMALVDTLPYYPQGDPGRPALLAILNRTSAAVVKYQDKKTGLWYQIPDQQNRSGNYFESSAACMFTYALAKGVRLGYLPHLYLQDATNAWKGIQEHFVHTDPHGDVEISGTVKGIDLGGKPSHDGSYSYYVDSPVISNDPKGIGAFLLAGSEMELVPIASRGVGEAVLLDGWYNSQKRKNAAGLQEPSHYKWSNFSSDGFSLFGHIFRSYGIKTVTLYSAPTYEKLKNAKLYIIVSPDTPAKNPNLHTLQPEDAEQIAAWVRRGGVLLLMENDPANADIEHLNRLSDRFGIHFNNVLSHHVPDHDFAAGKIVVTGDGPLFKNSHMLFMQDTCTISLNAHANALLRNKGDVLMATAKYGKGTVFAVADPWLYNEYTDGRKLPPVYDNYAGGKRVGALVVGTNWPRKHALRCGWAMYMKRVICFLAIISAAATLHAQATSELVAPIMQERLQTPSLVADELRHFMLLRVAPLALPSSADQWTTESARIRVHELSVLYHGWPQQWIDAPPDFEKTGVIERAGYRIVKLRYQVVPGLDSTALLYEPEHISGKIPAILDVSGHGPGGNAAEHIQKRCINQARRGMFALSLGWFDFGELQCRESP